MQRLRLGPGLAAVTTALVGWSALLGAALVVAGLLAATGVGAQEDVGLDDGAASLAGVVALVELPGECGADGPMQPGWSLDCRFVLRPGAGEHILYADLIDDRGSLTPCRVEPPVLRCSDVLPDRYDPGTVSFTLGVNQWSVDDAATVTTTWGPEQPYLLYSVGGPELAVFDGRPLRWSSYFSDGIDGLFISVRARDGGDVLRTWPIPVEAPGSWVDGSTKVDLPSGRYRWWPCVGPTADTCEEQAGGQPFQVVDGTPLELIDGHNRPTAERINVLFVGSGLGDTQEGGLPALPDLARQLLTIGEPTGVDVDGRAVGAGERAERLVWGPMATEPLRSHLDRFNFWYLEEDLADETSLLAPGSDLDGDLGFDLPNLQITALYHSDRRFASDARGTSFESPEPLEVGPRGRLRFGDARVWIPSYDPLSAAATVTHEWGHGLFGLRDEYYGFDDRGIATGYPNCAPDEETARTWWGSMIGQTDPFAAEVLAVERQRMQTSPYPSDGLVDRTTIAITAGGCYSDPGSVEVFRPSADSMMNSEVPVFGAVNRARVEEVLERFSGRGPMGTLDDLELECEALRGTINCTGHLRSHLDRPLSIVAIEGMPCEFGRGRPQPDGSVGPVPVSCTTIGSPTEPVDLTFKTERRSVAVIDVNPPMPPVPMESRIIPVDDTDESDESISAWRVIGVGVLLIVATIAIAFVERRRRSIHG